MSSASVSLPFFRPTHQSPHNHAERGVEKRTNTPAKLYKDTTEQEKKTGLGRERGRRALRGGLLVRIIYFTYGVETGLSSQHPTIRTAPLLHTYRKIFLVLLSRSTPVLHHRT